MAEDKTLSVSELNEYIKRYLESDSVLRRVCVAGEVSNFKRHTSGHLYFTLKDEGAAMRAVMFRSDAARLSFSPGDGARVLAQGAVSLYPRDGQVQLYVRAMREAGAGSLYLAFERLKKKLQAEGLFETARKRQLPAYPRRIALITSPTGAAVRDMIRVAGRRNDAVRLLLCPVLVQGAGAAEDIAAMLARVSKRTDIDAVIVGRGGGSIEDLWAFNEEIVVRAVAACAHPVVSAVGHETDVTLTDFAADVRAATPSAAAEVLVPDKEAMRGALAARMDALASSFTRATREKEAALDARRAQLMRQRPDMKLREWRITLDGKRERMDAAVARTLLLGAQRLRKRERMDAAIDRTLLVKGQELQRRGQRVEAISPLAVLKRGYALVRDTSGAALTSAALLYADEDITLTMADGQASARVREVHAEARADG